MSFELSTLLFSRAFSTGPRFSAIDRHVLSALCQRANNEGYTWPSMRYLTLQTSLSEEALRRSLQRLEGHGYIEIHQRFARKGRQTSNLFRVIRDRIEQLPSIKSLIEDDKDDIGDDSQQTNTVDANNPVDESVASQNAPEQFLHAQPSQDSPTSSMSPASSPSPSSMSPASSEALGVHSSQPERVNPSGDLGVAWTLDEYVSRTCKNESKEKPPAENPQAAPQGRKKKPQVTLKTFIEECERKGEMPIPEGDPIFAQAERENLPLDFLHLCWLEFKDQHMTIRSSKRQADWRATFRNAVRGNWYRLWYTSADGTVTLTSNGHAAKLRHRHREAA
jgi:DNA-binding transcriptional regulator YhcF (GntR family)